MFPPNFYLLWQNITYLKKFQSSFRALHSTETALLKVNNDLLLTTDRGGGAILINCLKSFVGIRDTALGWFTSYLFDRTCAATIGNHSSSTTQIAYGVSQGSILVPILFSIYMLPDCQIIQRHTVSFHFHADDTKIYLPLRPNNQRSLAAVLDCLKDVNRWMAHNFLQLNNSKSKIILFNLPTTITSPISLGPLSSNIKPTARNVGVVLDSDFTFIPHINKVVQSCFLHIRITKIFFLLSQPNLEKLIHALQAPGFNR